jgi:hypothetical protein
MLTWCGLAAIPVLAVAAAGPQLTAALRSDAGGQDSLRETWAFTTTGNRLTNPTGLTGTEVQEVWRNTARTGGTPPTPPPFGPPTPPPFPGP